MFDALSRAIASGVSLSTADALAYLMLVVVGILIVSSVAIAYIFIRKNRRENPSPATTAA